MRSVMSQINEYDDDDDDPTHIGRGRITRVNCRVLTSCVELFFNVKTFPERQLGY